MWQQQIQPHCQATLPVTGLVFHSLALALCSGFPAIQDSCVPTIAVDPLMDLPEWLQDAQFQKVPVQFVGALTKPAVPYPGILTVDRRWPEYG